MKNLFSTVLFLIMFFALSVYSQTVGDFKAEEGLEKAREYASKNLSSPKLFSIMTTNGTSQAGGVPIEIEFDFNTGKSEYWVYLFINSNDTTEYLYVAVFYLPGFDFFAYGIPFEGLDLSKYSVNQMLNLDNSEFNDSDFFAEKIKANQEFMDFYKNNESMTLYLMYIRL